MTKLGPLADKCGVLKFPGSADHASTLNGFVQDLSHAVKDYCLGTTEPSATGHRQASRCHPAPAGTSHPRDCRTLEQCHRSPKRRPNRPSWTLSPFFSPISKLVNSPSSKGMNNLTENTECALGARGKTCRKELRGSRKLCSQMNLDLAHFCSSVWVASVRSQTHL